MLRTHTLDGVTSAAGQAANGAVCLSRGNVVAREAREEARVGTAPSTRAGVAVGLAFAAEGAGAGRAVGVRDEDLALLAIDDGVNALKQVTLGEDLGARVDLESVAVDVAEVVVDGVQEGSSGDLGASAGGVVDVVVLQGDFL